MSKQSEAKENQGYRKDAPMCKNCSLFTSKTEEVKSKWSSQTFQKESEFRCAIGGFKTMKMSWCIFHEFVKPTTQP